MGPIAIIFFNEIIQYLVKTIYFWPNFPLPTKQRPAMISVVRVPQGLLPQYGLPNQDSETIKNSKGSVNVSECKKICPATSARAIIVKVTETSCNAVFN